MNKIKWLILDMIISAVLVFFDQFTKIWAVGRLKDGEPIVLINGVLQFYYLPEGNTGAAFGILTGHRILFLCIALFVVAAVLYALFCIPRTGKYMFLRILLVFIAAGGAGNMIDRFRLGYVIDFIYFYLINFPIFNVADCYVTVSTILVALLILFKYKEDDLKELEGFFGIKNKKRPDED